MRTTDIIKKMGKIDGIVLKEANFGVGIENKIVVSVKDKSDYPKWDYFIKRVNELKCRIRIRKRYPEITFIFPLRERELEDSLGNFEMALDKKFYLVGEPPEENVTIIAKVTNLCNLDCQYCYDKPFRDSLGHNGFLKLDRLEKAIKMATEYAKNVTLLWHGGEPSLAGLDYYRTIYEEILPKFPYADFEIDMQTNGTLLNEEWFKFSKKYNMEFGSSYNATQEDLRHTTSDNLLGSETQNIHSVLKNIDEAEKHGVTIGVIDVLTKENHERIIEIYEFYKKVNVNACFNEIHNSGEAEKHDFLFITDEDQKKYEQVTTEYFTHWANDKSEEMFVDRYASEYIQMILTKRSGVCHNGGNCINHWMGINSNGDIYPCDRALPRKYRIGNVADFESCQELYDHPKYVAYRTERYDKIDKFCMNCIIYDYCHGGCPMEDLDEHNSAAIPNTYSCKMRKLNLLCAYKALLNTDIDMCSNTLRTFLIKNCLLLPREIPTLLSEIGLEDEYSSLDYSVEKASLSSDEFKLFANINQSLSELMCEGDHEIAPCNCDEILADDRLDRAIKAMKDRAECLQSRYAEETKPVM